MKQSEYPPAELRCGENFVAMEQCLTFTFMTDQSTLPPFIDGLKNMIS